MKEGKRIAASTPGGPGGQSGTPDSPWMRKPVVAGVIARRNTPATSTYLASSPGNWIEDTGLRVTRAAALTTEPAPPDPPPLLPSLPSFCETTRVHLTQRQEVGHQFKKALKKKPKQ